MLPFDVIADLIASMEVSKIPPLLHSFVQIFFASDFIGSILLAKVRGDVFSTFYYLVNFLYL